MQANHLHQIVALGVRFLRHEQSGASQEGIAQTKKVQPREIIDLQRRRADINDGIARDIQPGTLLVAVGAIDAADIEIAGDREQRRIAPGDAGGNREALLHPARIFRCERDASDNGIVQARLERRGFIEIVGMAEVELHIPRTRGFEARRESDLPRGAVSKNPAQEDFAVLERGEFQRTHGGLGHFFDERGNSRLFRDDPGIRGRGAQGHGAAEGESGFFETLAIRTAQENPTPLRGIGRTVNHLGQQALAGLEFGQGFLDMARQRLIRQNLAKPDENSVPALGEFFEFADVACGDSIHGSVNRLPEPRGGDEERPELRITRLFRQQD